MTSTDIIDTTSREIVEYAAAPATLYGTNDPTEIIAQATKQANALADVVKQKKLYTTISGREHVRIEGWTTLGTLVGVFAVPVWTRPIDVDGERLGWEARVEARTLAGGVVGAADAECLKAERNWGDRDDFALRSMAQTRAASKALRLPLGFIMTLAGFEATPAEEMTFESNGGQQQRPQQRTGGRNAKPADKPGNLAEFWREMGKLKISQADVFGVAQVENGGELYKKYPKQTDLDELKAQMIAWNNGEDLGGGPPAEEADDLPFEG